MKLSKLSKEDRDLYNRLNSELSILKNVKLSKKINSELIMSLNDQINKLLEKYK